MINKLHHLHRGEDVALPKIAAATRCALQQIPSMLHRAGEQRLGVKAKVFQSLKPSSISAVIRQH